MNKYEINDKKLSLDDEAILSKTITFLRFPLTIAVVLIHTVLVGLVYNGTSSTEENQYTIYNFYYHILSEELARIAVPLFFFISGFLFFYHTDFSLSIYKTKLKNRARSLLLPYILWNILVAVLLLCAQLFATSLISGNHKPIINYGWTDWINIFWAANNNLPIAIQFWFIRDLMIAILFTPLIYQLIKYFHIYLLVVLGLLWIFNFQLSILRFGAFLFFSFGAWFCINHRHFTICFRPLRQLCSIIYIILLIFSTCLWYSHSDYYHIVSKINIVIGLIAVVSWSAYGISNNIISENKFLASSSFFIFAYHELPLVLMTKSWVKLWSPLNEWTLLLGYILIPTIIIAIGIGIYALIRKYLPTFTSIITGGR